MRTPMTQWLRLAALVATLALISMPAVALAADFGQPVAGQRVYDQAGALTPDEAALIDQRAAAVEQAGAPVVVFLRARDTDYDGTVSDGRDLMEQWDIQSAPDARDGVVIFFNLKPDDLHHGDYALIAGKSLIDGNLPQRELNRIADDMQPALKDGDIGAAIVLALEAIEHDLTFGPPPPPPPSTVERFADTVAGGALSVMNALAIIATAIGGWLLAQRIPRRRTTDAPVAPATAPPTDLPPGLAGSLVAGRVDDTAIGATMLDLTAREAIAIEPAGKKKIQLRLLDQTRVRSGYEQMIWDALAGQAGPDGVVENNRIGKVRSAWGGIRAQMRAELVERGWFDAGAGDQRRPFWIVATVFYVLAAVVILLSIISGSLWGIVAMALLGAIGTFAIALAAMVPNTTPEGDEVAAPWRGYKDYLKTAGKNPQASIDLDTAVPYALALGTGQAFNKRLEHASAAGYLPVWMGGPQTSGAWSGGFYPYWIAFNSSVSPSSSGSAASGASAGSGAAGGSF